jgi:hypothetical protein
MDHWDLPTLTTYGTISESDLAENAELIKAPWNPDEPIETVFKNGEFCRDFAQEGQDPITDATYTRILVDIFDKSGVLEKAVEDWEKKPPTDKTLANAIDHFQQANEHRLRKLAKGSKEIFAANAATTTATSRNGDTQPAQTTSLTLDGIGYCWSHGICNHHGAACTAPKEGHKKEATYKNRMGGSTMVRIPGFPRNNRPNRRNQETGTTAQS